MQYKHYLETAQDIFRNNPDIFAIQIAQDGFVSSVGRQDMANEKVLDRAFIFFRYLHHEATANCL